MGAALAAVAVAGGLAYGSLGGSSARLSGADTRFVPGTEAPAPAGTGQPVPRLDSSPVAPSPRSQAKRSTLASPAAGAGAADAVAGGEQSTSAPHGAGRMIVTQGQGVHRTVTVSGPRASSTPAGTHHTTQTSARLTVSPASLGLGEGSTGQVTLSAAGGPVSWAASVSAAGVAVSPASGQLAAGHRATVTVTVQRQGGSGGSATVQINGAQVPVTWAATATASAAPSGGSAPSGGYAPSGGSAPAAPPARRYHHQPPGGSGGPASS
jgi:hypothetical protein